MIDVTLKFGKAYEKLYKSLSEEGELLFEGTIKGLPFPFNQIRGIRVKVVRG